VAQDDLRELPRFLRLLEVEPGMSERALEIAVRLRLGAVYDAHYLALAEHLGCETVDGRRPILARGS